MSLHAGISGVTITPPVGVELCGYGYYRGRASTEIYRDLRAKAIVLDDGTQRVAIIACDLIGVTAAITAQVRAQVEAATGIPRDHILVACTHTHSGPTTIAIRGLGEPDPEYLALLPRLVAGAAKIAAQRMVPAQARFGSATLTSLAHNRVVEGGPTDSEVSVLRLDRGDGSLLATLAHFSCHAVTHRDTNTRISGDYPGAAMALVEAAHPGASAASLQGTCGDINPVLVHSDRVEEAGRQLADAVLHALAAAGEPMEPMVRAHRAEVVLPQVAPERAAVEGQLEEWRRARAQAEVGSPEQRCARFEVESAEFMLRQLDAGAPLGLRTEIQALRVGDLALACQPGEMFVAFGLEVKERAPSPHTAVVGYANDFAGYFPDPADFDRGGYAAAQAPKFCDTYPYAPNVGSVVTETMLEAVEAALCAPEQ